MYQGGTERIAGTSYDSKISMHPQRLTFPQNITRKVLLDLMDVTHTADLPKPHSDYFWMETGNTGQVRTILLRPNWELSPRENTIWMNEAIPLIREVGAMIKSDLPPDFLDSIKDKEILAAIQGTFRSWRRRWKETQRGALVVNMNRQVERRRQRARFVRHAPSHSWSIIY